jgi:hypothetical protein
MSDGAKSCFGVFFLFASVALAFAAFFGGWIGWEFRVGVILGLGAFAFFLVLAGYMFVTIRDYSWLGVTIPGVLGGLYTIVPDLLLGNVDDIFALVLGAVISGLLYYRRDRKQQKQLGPGR